MISVIVMRISDIMTYFPRSPERVIINDFYCILYINEYISSHAFDNRSSDRGYFFYVYCVPYSYNTMYTYNTYTIVVHLILYYALVFLRVFLSYDVRAVETGKKIIINGSRLKQEITSVVKGRQRDTYGTYIYHTAI